MNPQLRHQSVVLILLSVAVSTISVPFAQDSNTKAGSTQSSQRPETPAQAYNPSNTTAGGVARGLEMAQKNLNLWGWASWAETSNERMKDLARKELSEKAPGTSVVIHVGSTDKTDLSQAPYNPAPAASSMDVVVIGRGSSKEDAIENAFLVPSIRTETQTHRVTVVTRTADGIALDPVTENDVKSAVYDAFKRQDDRLKNEIQTAEERITKNKRSQDQARTAGDPEREKKAAADRAKAEADKAKAEKERSASEARQREFRDAIDKSTACKSNCSDAWSRSSDQLEKAQRYANTALCANADSGGGGGICDKPGGCKVCASLFGKERNLDWRQARSGYSTLNSALILSHGGMQGLAKTSKLPFPTSAPKELFGRDKFLLPKLVPAPGK